MAQISSDLVDQVCIVSKWSVEKSRRRCAHKISILILIGPVEKKKKKKKKQDEIVDYSQTMLTLHIFKSRCDLELFRVMLKRMLSF